MARRNWLLTGRDSRRTLLMLSSSSWRVNAPQADRSQRRMAVLQSHFLEFDDESLLPVSGVGHDVGRGHKTGDGLHFDPAAGSDRSSAELDGGNVAPLLRWPAGS